VFVPGTKHQPEARIETKIAGITFMCQLGPAEWCPSYVYRFAEPIPYRFIDEEMQKPPNWLPPVFKKHRRGSSDTHFIRLEYTDESETATQLVFYYRSGYPLDRQVDEYNRYVESTAYALQEQRGLSWKDTEWRPLTLETVESPDQVTHTL
jgi:hypothetical protein